MTTQASKLRRKVRLLTRRLLTRVSQADPTAGRLTRLSEWTQRVTRVQMRNIRHRPGCQRTGAGNRNLARMTGSWPADRRLHLPLSTLARACAERSHVVDSGHRCWWWWWLWLRGLGTTTTQCVGLGVGLPWLLRSRARPVTGSTRWRCMLARLTDTLTWWHWHAGHSMHWPG